MSNLVLILGDQLSHDISSLDDFDPSRDRILICEVWEEATYVKHHKKKIAFLFSAMRHFAEELKQRGFKVHYTKLDDPKNAGSFCGEVQRALKSTKATSLIVTFPGEWRVWQEMKKWKDEFGVTVEIRPDRRFLIGPKAFAEWAKGHKNLRMEFFYRQMRKQHDILMDGDQPEGGAWNYDSENRKPAKNRDFEIPQPPRFSHDDITKDVLKLVAARFADHFGDLEPFDFAVTRKDALKLLKDFIKHRLPSFGDYQDAMLTGEPVLYHSHLSFYINCGLLQPMEVVQAAEETYRKGHVPLNAAEGFIRQIVGWREYMRGIYWLRMPHFKEENFLNAKRKLPWFYWSGETDMNCLHHCVTETKQNAYAHHIQRLMVLGNFALIAGIHPDEVNEWYMVVYADAYEWVELPNVSGMILFADGGYLGSKPYAASGAYINKMSDYCSGCRYDVKQKNGPDACPFNYLYWNFMLQHRDKLERNPRIGFAYKTLDRMDEAKIEAVKKDAASFLAALE